MKGLNRYRHWRRGAVFLLIGAILLPMVYTLSHGDFIYEALYAHPSEKHAGLRLTKHWRVRYSRGKGMIDFLWVGPVVLYEEPDSVPGLIDHMGF